MRRREFISVLAGATAWPLGALAQTKMPVVGVLTIFGPIPDQFVTFRRALAEAGYVAGANLAIEYRYANWKPEVLPAAAGDLVRRNVNAIFAVTPEAVDAARNATSSIPIVAVDLERDPVAMGYVQSVAHPGGNLTGMYLDLPEFCGKQLELLKQVFPRSRIAIFGVPGLNALQFDTMVSVARTLAVEPEIIEVRSPDDFEGALAAAAAKHIEAGVMLSSPLVGNFSQRIGELALAKRIALISFFLNFPQAGGFMAYGMNVWELYARCGTYVAKILQGAKPSDLPIQRPEKFVLIISLKTAEALGVTVPPALLATADHVIE
jgi:putative tryptophan/tyrosine transport system substrate-binding protein